MADKKNITSEDSLMPLYVDEREVSRMTGIKVATLRIHRHKRKGIPYIKYGSLVRYKVQDVIDYMHATRIA